jgi:GT2 family glycosyltransferase
MSGFDSTFATSEDRELCDRWLHHGYHMTYAPEVIVYHAHALTLRTFWRQHFAYGQGAMRFHRARAQRRSGQSWQELGFYLRLPSLLCRALVSVRNEQALRLIPLLAVWQGANTAGFAWEWMQQIVGKGG